MTSVFRPGYLDALGFDRHPFPQTPDAAAYYSTRALEESLAETLHCIEAHKGFVLVTGEVGTGKSTFSRRLLNKLDESSHAISLVFNTFLQGAALLEEINTDFGLEVEAGAGINEGLRQLNNHLLAQRQAGRTSVVVIDDAQNLSLESLELLRLLSNLETNQEKLVQIVLVGQPELLDKLALPDIRQLTSRIVLHCRLNALSRVETVNYVRFRLSAAGNARAVELGRGVFKYLHRVSGGNPRRIHLIMDRCLYGVVARNRRVVDMRLIRAAAGEILSNVGTRMVPPIAAPRRGPGLVWGLVLILTAGVIWQFGRLIPVAELWRAAANSIPLSTQAIASVPEQTTVSPSGKHELPIKISVGPVQSAHQAPKPVATSQVPVALTPWQECLRHHELGGAEPFIRQVLHGSSSLADQDSQVLATRWHLHVVVLGQPLPAEQIGSDVLCQRMTDGRQILLWQPNGPVPAVRYGAKGDAVARAQEDLTRLGLYSGTLDGKAGLKTLRAIQAFQTDIGVTATGYMDTETAYRLEQAVAALPPAPTKQQDAESAAS